METFQRYQYREITYNLHLSRLKYNCKSGESGENSSNRIFSVRLGGKSGPFGLGYKAVFIKCREIKTKVPTLTNHNSLNYRCVWLTRSAENVSDWFLVFTFDWMKKWRDFFKANRTADLCRKPLKV